MGYYENAIWKLDKQRFSFCFVKFAIKKIRRKNVINHAGNLFSVDKFSRALFIRKYKNPRDFKYKRR